MDPSPSLLRRLAGVPLGLVVVWQVFFLLSANVLRLVEDSKPHLKPYLKEIPFARPIASDWLNDEGCVHAALTAVGRMDRRWSELTGQVQAWSLFAPSVYDHVPFPVVELRWDDDRLPARSAAALVTSPAAGRTLEALCLEAAAGQVQAAGAPAPVVLVADNEPADPRRFLRFGRFRLRRYEGYVGLVLATNDQPREEVAEPWRGKIESQLREEADRMRAYLRWRLAAFQRSHPELPPPRQVILGVRVYRVPPPPGPEPWDWEHPARPEPVARWLPGTELGPDYYPLEMYNPVVRRFESLRR